jgi:hypothetical protein
MSHAHPTKRLALILALTALTALTAVPSAQAAFGVKEFDLGFANGDGSPATQAGSHPFAVVNVFKFNSTTEVPGYLEAPDGSARDIEVQLPDGLVGQPGAIPRCANSDFIEFNQETKLPKCSNSSAVGTISVRILKRPDQTVYINSPVYNLIPPPGAVQKLGFIALGVPVTIVFHLSPNPPYNVVASLHDIAQPLPFFDSVLSVWGDPASSVHDKERGSCIQASAFQSDAEIHTTGESCPTNVASGAFLTLPRSCTGPLTTTFTTTSWEGDFAAGSAQTHDNSEPPSPIGLTGCGKLGFAPTIETKPTTKAAESSTGLDLSLDVHDEGITNPAGLAQSDIKKAVVTLPEGMTVNPSSAEGLEVCSEADLDRETLTSAPGEGCPEASKLGTIEVQTPLLEESLKGALYIAEPYKNPFGTLIALYFVIESKSLGVIVKQAAKVEPDPKTGQLISTVKDIPQLPFSSFKLHFREGARSPLVSPPACGEYATKAELTPWSGGAPVTTTSTFKIVAGTGESPCPSGATPPFNPGFEAGTNNNNAGAYSPFYMRLTRRDGDQDLTRFAAELPPGMVAKLAGTTQCPDSAIASAKAKTGKAELASPSCPASSQIGRVMAGAGVGSVLTYVPGKVYLSGPYKGAPLSVIGVVPAVAGPFDVGTVVTRQALQIDPRTAEVRVDDAASDPIPHILAGIPLKVRDIRVYVDKQDFTLNPTSCDPFAVGAQLWGGGADVFGSADDSPVSREDRFQAANCATLGFKPSLSLALKGGTKRGGHPALTGTYRPRGGDANLSNLVLRLPRSAFLDQAHIRTICTRVQFAAKACPEGAVYGHATAYTPILDQPLEGPVYLRSSNHNLPDFVAALHGLVDVEAVARIDSVKGGIRARFEDVPDAPLTKVVVRMQGAKKGLIVNSRNLCGAKPKANAQFSGQNGKEYSAKPVVKAGCGGKAHKSRGR